MKSTQRKIFAIVFAVCLSAIAGNVVAQEYYPDIPSGQQVKCQMFGIAYEQAIAANDFATALNIMEIMESKNCFNFSL
ncbi:MAG: hypothetical protein JWP38_1812 [Herbaspirillum sp.]|nr:hypothetical protein [Herbaspirillum sp.]